MTIEAKRELRAFGDEVRRGRNALKISQEDFAELSGLHRTYVGQIERGEKNISFVNILRVSRALGMKPSQLLDAASL